MSMNIHFNMVRNAIQIFRKPGKNGEKGKTIRKEIKLIEHLPVWQTPTEVTMKILASSDPVKEYFDWVQTHSNIHYEPVYAPDDLFCENDPVSFVPVDHAQEHIKQFTTLMNRYKDEGYELDVFMM